MFFCISLSLLNAALAAWQISLGNPVTAVIGGFASGFSAMTAISIRDMRRLFHIARGQD